MKNCFLILIALTASPATAQNTPPRFELGSTLLTINNVHGFNAQAPSQVQAINGLFFRYNKQRSAFRFQASYSESFQKYTPNLVWIDALGGNIFSKDFGFGAGVQRTVLKQRDWLYIFADLSYRNIFSTGSRLYSNGPAFQSNYSLSTNALEATVGVGLKFKLADRILLSTECGYSLRQGWTKYRETNAFTGIHSNYKFRGSSVNPLQVKVHLTWSF
jgi:hypothetical protein